MVLSGLSGSVISAKILDRGNPQYKNLFNLLNMLGAILIALFLLSLPSGLHKALFGTNLFLYGLFMIPTFSIIFPYVAELTYPSHEAVSTALMLFMCRLFATCFGIFGTLLAETDDPKSTQGFYKCMSFIACASLLGMLPAFFVNEELRKVSMKNFYQFFATTQRHRAIKINHEVEDESEELPSPSESAGVRSSSKVVEKSLKVQSSGNAVEMFELSPEMKSKVLYYTSHKILSAP